ncbi:acetate/propionate family kinase [Spirochaeta isovalerica]|uniref:Acetate kinase n=1 Tax=Spirochaeta isovalerica TaxID=150 RepID=A0A841RH55_9SPIO|nr:acetate kinase [Spirochaeta isovalerica]MBB6482527.1 acetate kinase [Spirochaeta isovalerica]
MQILVINSGSSSIKFQWLESLTGEVFYSGLVERIGMASGRLSLRKGGGKSKKTEKPIANHKEGLTMIFSQLQNMNKIEAVGHRVVNGGEYFSAPCLIDEQALKKIRKCIPLAPLHNPANCQGIEAALSLLPHVPHIAVFDTSFHRTIKEKNYLYAIPYDYYSRDGIRKYGFHGSSHKYVTIRAAEMLNKDVKDISGISCHLGNGVSLTAIRHGCSIDTSMGYGTISGVPMGTRSGDLDPAVILNLLQEKEVSPDQLSDLLYRESGLKGLSGLSPDMRDLLKAESEGHERAAAAVEIFVNSIRKYIGAYLTQLGGKPDFLIFTAGIGENSAEIRSRVLKGMGYLGFRLDEEKNAEATGESLISRKDSPVPVLLIPTNEEWMIASEAEELLTSEYISESSLTFLVDS